MKEAGKEKKDKADAQEKSLDNVPVALSVNGSDVFVRESIRVLRDTGDREIIGYLGFMSDVTNEQRYQRLFEHLKKKTGSSFSVKSKPS